MNLLEVVIEATAGEILALAEVAAEVAAVGVASMPATILVLLVVSSPFIDFPQ